MSRRTRHYSPIHLEHAESRRSLAPSREYLLTIAAGLVGRYTGTAYGAPENASISRAQIFRELASSAPELTPLPRIAECAAMYPPRISELREDLRPLGLTIQCYEQRVVVPGNRFKQVHTFYRIERIQSEPHVNAGNEPLHQVRVLESDNRGFLFAPEEPRHGALLLAYEMGHRGAR